LENENGGCMRVYKVIYGLSAGASIFFGLWQRSIEAGIFLWLAFVTIWEMVAYFIDKKR